MIRLLAASLLAATPVLGAEINVAVGGFDRIALSGSPDVTVATGRAVSVRASGGQKELDRLDIRTEGGVLKIGVKRGHWDWNGWNGDGKVRIAVTVPMVRGIDIGGSGSVSVDRVKAAAFDGQLSGSGWLRVAALDTGHATFAVSGSGALEAKGRCDSATVSVAGSGQLRLGELKCATLKADIAGSGDIEAYATRTAAVAVMGSGDVHVAGGAKCAVSKAGSGSVDCG